MKKSGPLWIILIVIIVLGAGIYILAQSSDDKPATTSTEKPSSTQSDTSTTDAAQTTEDTNKSVAATITYSDSGFSPSSVTVKAGDTIEVKNTSTQEIKFASDPHPTHTNNTQLNLNEIAAGASRTFSVSNKGTWGYHNHFDTSKTGTIIVE